MNEIPLQLGIIFCLYLPVCRLSVIFQFACRAGDNTRVHETAANGQKMAVAVEEQLTDDGKWLLAIRCQVIRRGNRLKNCRRWVRSCHCWVSDAYLLLLLLLLLSPSLVLNIYFFSWALVTALQRFWSGQQSSSRGQEKQNGLPYSIKIVFVLDC